jgi:prevent-host-death family protein
MPTHPLLTTPDRVEEPERAEDYLDLVSRVASTHQPVIVSRGGTALAVVVAVEHLELLRELLAQREAESLADQVDWARLAQTSPPLQQWFDEDEPRPF